MMRQTRGWNGLRTTVVALGIAALLERRCGRTDDLRTVGSTIDSAGVAGVGAISFNSVSSGNGNPRSSLGEFQVAELPKGPPRPTPHGFQLPSSKMIDGVEPIPNAGPIVVAGALNGTVNGSNQSTVVATFDPTTIPEFATGLYTNSLSIPDLNLSLVPSTSNGGRTTAQAYLIATTNAPPVPEPTTIALFLTTLAGLGLRHRVRAGRAA
ncbi:MAG: PEP-CTERM sorting domain-containing protein [Singulisphaera sp.]